MSTPVLPAISAGAAKRIDLPERVVPRHDGEHDAERLVARVRRATRSTARRVRRAARRRGTSRRARRRTACPSRTSAPRRGTAAIGLPISRVIVTATLLDVAVEDLGGPVHPHRALRRSVVLRSVRTAACGARDARARPRPRRAASNSCSVTPVAGLMTAMAMVLLVSLSGGYSKTSGCRASSSRVRRMWAADGRSASSTSRRRMACDEQVVLVVHAAVALGAERRACTHGGSAACGSRAAGPVSPSTTSSSRPLAGEVELAVEVEELLDVCRQPPSRPRVGRGRSMLGLVEERRR